MKAYYWGKANILFDSKTRATCHKKYKRVRYTSKEQEKEIM